MPFASIVYGGLQLLSGRGRGCCLWLLTVPFPAVVPVELPCPTESLFVAGSRVNGPSCLMLAVDDPDVPGIGEPVDADVLTREELEEAAVAGVS